jgi:hypothetical protein
MDWEFYVCCLTNENSVWTRWRWRCTDGDHVIEPRTDFTTLTACKADAFLHGFDPGSSRILKIDGQLPPFEENLHQLLPAASPA